MAKVTFTNEVYVRSHGTTPKGRGVWVFSTSANPSFCWSEDELMMSPNLTFTEAKKWARAKVQAAYPGQNVEVFVQP